MALTAIEKLYLKQMDVKTAYLYVSLEKNILMMPPLDKCEPDECELKYHKDFMD